MSHTITSGDLRADRRYDYAQGCLDDGDPDAAAEMAEQTLEIAPRFAPAWFLLGRARETRYLRGGQAGDHHAALRAYAAALDIDPEDAQGARLALVRIGAGDAVTAISPGYVRALFDAYAPRFDRHLVEGLSYRGHGLVVDALDAVAGPGAPLGRVIDLGCGTGLVGAALAGRPEHLTGIDLSPGMLAEAGRRGLYHRLVEGELIAALAAEDPDSADCVTAADVMIYVGDVLGMVSGSARVLRAGGRFAFTVQSHSGDGLILGPDARYAHGDALVRETLAAAGLDLERFAPAVARRENGVDVPGRVIVARRPDRSRFRCRP
ncbi:methyltransferase domain-containing protein [Methylobacterium sp. J-078]|uniref:methyltransferase domain-containing protein n=1 Tax=Methylobacterium sp. J-078 TaxID=2836657 RepID=UPI001FBB07A0|nr:methyltransferase domain-containing protein [Methylobacterium sp. J-078]MCJ2044686.1 methyltransferase domain-containing protein [Methylobacterium sp. J-078]